MITLSTLSANEAGFQSWSTLKVSYEILLGTPSVINMRTIGAEVLLGLSMRGMYLVNNS
jgi:hypothetical protein